MSHLKRSELLAYARSAPTQSLATVQAQQQRAEQSKQAGKIPRIFLSHSHSDKDLVLPAVLFLKSQGVEVYVDWLDGEMSDRTSGETARKIKTKIKEHDKFVILVTENSKNSHWVPWELGIADGEKGIPRIASFPIRNEDREFTGNEYFSIYPRIQEVSSEWYVWLDDPISFKKLKQWLTEA